MRSRDYLPITLTVIFEKKGSNDIAMGLPAISVFSMAMV